jgi:DNA-binding transcriptional LysR family regulator
MNLNRLGPGLLHAFLVVAKVGKISEAARRLHLSQPAVTAQIRRLEAELDTPLFIRSVRGVTLTPLGAHLQERLERVFADLEAALSELDQPGKLKGILKFAASTTSAAYFVPNIFARFRRYHPEVGLHLIVGNAKDVLELVREQHVGLGLLGGHERSPGVRFEQFMPDEIVAVCAPRIRDPKLRHAIGNLKSAQDLEHLPLIWREQGAGTRAVVEQVLKEHGVNVRKLDQRVERDRFLFLLGDTRRTCHGNFAGNSRSQPANSPSVFLGPSNWGLRRSSRRILSIRQFDPNRAVRRKHTEMEGIGLNTPP